MYLMIARGSLVILILIFILVKLFLFYRYERDWNFITFFYFTKMQLKLTNRRNLRHYRRNQNLLSKGLVLFILLFLFSTFINILIIA
jgi:hypothetical protein